MQILLYYVILYFIILYYNSYADIIMIMLYYI